jgi:hypothetical protein
MQSHSNTRHNHKKQCSCVPAVVQTPTGHYES